ncbi:unnamed protein product [Sympodiomycopsis kandeliae]
MTPRITSSPTKWFIVWAVLILSIFTTSSLAQDPSSVSSSDPLASQPSTGVVSQTPGQTTLATSTTSTALPSSTRVSIVDASATPYVLTRAVPVRASLAISNDSNAPAFFSLPLTGEQQIEPIFVALSLCDGPQDGIVPSIASNASNTARMQLSQSAQVRLYVSLIDEITRPGPDDVPDKGSQEGDMKYTHGGWAEMSFSDQDDPVRLISVGVWPPEMGWGVTGNFTVQLVVSTGVPLQTLQNNYGIALDDTDINNALMTSFNYSSGQAPNISLVVLPTFGAHSLPSTYYNSSFCAIADGWSSYLGSADPPRINSSETTRGSTKQYSEDDKRLQFQVSNLERATNYTAWLVSVNSTGRDLKTTGAGIALYPGIKFLTKKTDTCRLVYNVPFCPQVAYSIPIGPDVSTSQALSIINDTVSPNYANFSKTLSTFPCDDDYFGLYSSVRGCSDCLRSYQDWLCAVTMPRCTDPIEVTADRNFSSQTAAAADIYSLTGKTSALNTDLLPYVLNRNITTSRQSYFGKDLQVTRTYGEVLPCLYTCLFVQRNCPNPLVQWTCPQWDITAQADYGTFADSGLKGLGAAENGGAGYDLARWGGPLRCLHMNIYHLNHFLMSVKYGLLLFMRLL